MDILTKEELKLLMEQRGDFCISIFMPTHRTGDVQQDPIRLRNLMAKAQEKLVAAGARPAEARTILEPVQRTVESNVFWQQRGDGLAMFINHPSFRYYQVHFGFDEKVVVGDRFAIKPLLPAVSSGNRFYVLAISQNDIRLLDCTEFSCHRVELEGIVPLSRAEALKYEAHEKQSQFHTSTAPGAGAGRRSAIFFGMGAIPDDYKKDILEYFQQVDRGLRKILHDGKAPLVFAGVEYLLPIYQGANTYQNLLGKGVAGNPETMTDSELHSQALALVKPVFQKAQDDAMAKLRELLGTGFASTNIAEIVPAAVHGRVGTLILTLGPEEWGKYDPKANTVVQHSKPEPGDQDLLDFAAVYTLTQSGIVYTVPGSQMRDGSPVAALFRY